MSMCPGLDRACLGALSVLFAMSNWARIFLPLSGKGHTIFGSTRTNFLRVELFLLCRALDP